MKIELKKWIIYSKRSIKYFFQNFKLWKKKWRKKISLLKICDNKAKACVARIGKAAPDFKGQAVLPSLEFGDNELSQF